MANMYLLPAFRPCYVKPFGETKRKALFHKWISGPVGDGLKVYGLVELEDHHCICVPISQIIFIDAGKFDQICWNEKPEIKEEKPEPSKDKGVKGVSLLNPFVEALKGGSLNNGSIQKS